MKKWFLTVLSALCALTTALGFVACGGSGGNTGGGDTGGGEETSSYLVFNTLIQQGQEVGGVVDTEAAEFDFNDEVTVYGDITYAVSLDETLEDTFEDKVVPLSDFENVYYVLQIKDETIQTSYKVTLYYLEKATDDDLFTYTVDSHPYSGTDCVEITGVTDFVRRYCSELTVPAAISGLEVWRIAEEAFKDCAKLESLVSLNASPSCNFEGCTALKVVYTTKKYKISLPDGVELYYYAESEPLEKDRNYWSYDEDGEIIVWPKEIDIIRVAYQITGYGTAFMEQWAAEFEMLHPEYTVRLEGSETMTAEFGFRLETYNVPDVFMVSDTAWQRYAATGYLVNLDEVYNASADYQGRGETIKEFLRDGIEDYGKVTFDNVSIEGETGYYAIPFTDGATGIVYNKTMFENCGWKVPETFDELLALCDTINAARIPTGNSQQPYVKPFAVFGSYGSYIGDTWWAQYEGGENYEKFFDYESPEVYEQQGRVEALKAFERLFYDEVNAGGKINTAYGISAHTDAQMCFGGQYCAMILEGAWLESEGATYLKGGFEYAMMPTPFLENAKKDENGNYKKILASQAGDFMCVPAEADNVEGAIEFLKYVNSRQGCESYTRATNGALRPFEYKPSEIDGISASNFMKSCWEIYETSEVVYHYSTNPMNWSNRLGAWPGEGGVYDGILVGKYVEYDDYGDYITDEDGNVPPQAIKICNLCTSNAIKNWESIKKEIGIK